MTATFQEPGQAERTQPPGRVRRWTESRVSWALGLVCGLVALAVRAVGLRGANDVFIDELLYSDFAAQIAHGHFPNEGGRPFLLHPPGSLLLNGAVIRVFGLSGSPIDLVLELRWVNAVLGALTVVLVFALVRKVSTLRLALAAALLVTFDPFVLRNNGRVMIETPATLWLLAGWLTLLAASASPRPRRALAGEFAAGLLLGLAVVTKDMTAVPAIGALFVAVMWRRTLPFRTALRVGATACVPYAAYLVFLSVSGVMPLWLDDKSAGLLRMTGIRQDTGFNAAPVSLVSRLVAELPRFGTSYVLLVVALPVAIIACLNSSRAGRFLGIAALCTGLMCGYTLVGGAAEEQFGYYVVLTAVPAAAVAVRTLTERGLMPRRPALVVGTAYLIASVALGGMSRTVHDDGFSRAEAWMDTHLPRGADVGVTGVTGEYAFPGADVSPSLSSLLDNDDEYVLTSSAPLAQGYGYASPELVPWLERNARSLFTFSGPSNGETVVWRLDKAALTRSVSGGVTLPPVTVGER